MAWGLGPGAWGLGPGAWGLGFGVWETTWHHQLSRILYVNFTLPRDFGQIEKVYLLMLRLRNISKIQYLHSSAALAPLAH